MRKQRGEPGGPQQGQSSLYDRNFFREHSVDSLKKEWGHLSEAVRREVVESGELQQLAASFIDTPVDERLPVQFFEQAAAVNTRVGMLWDRYADNMQEFLRLPVIAYEFSHETVNVRTALKAHYLSGSAGNHYEISVSPLEHQVIILRHQFARDVKRLALSAVMSQEDELELDETGRIQLDSGVRIVANTEHPITADIIDPRDWKEVVQVKDRVYIATINGEKYVVKEYATAHHKDTREKAYPSQEAPLPNDSSVEYAYARYFEHLGPVEDGDVHVEWETPLGYVQTPDGYTFCLFAFDQRMVRENEIAIIFEQEKIDAALMKKIYDHILAHPDVYAEDWEQMHGMADIVYRHPELFDIDIQSSFSSKRKPTIIYDDFARVYARRLIDRSANVLSDAIVDRGFINTDTDGYERRIHVDPETQRMIVDIVAFDFEFYEFAGDTHVERHEKRVDFRVQHLFENVDLQEDHEGNRCTPAQQLLYIAALAQEYPDSAERLQRENDRFKREYGHTQRKPRIQL